jgi:DNA-directed RNA polymerase subunit beta'
MVIEFEEVRSIKPGKESSGKTVELVIGRSGEIRIIDENTRAVLDSGIIPYGAHLFVKEGEKVEKGQLICEWDPYNAVIISEFSR